MGTKMVEKNNTLSSQNTSITFLDIKPKSLRSKKYELTIEKSAGTVTGTISIYRKKNNTTLYAPWKDVLSGTNQINLALPDDASNDILTYEFTDADVYIDAIRVDGANIAGGTVRVSLTAW